MFVHLMRPAPVPTPVPAPPGLGHRRELALAGAFVLLVAAGLLVNLGTRPLEFEEPRRALVALEMSLRGNLLVPTTNAVPYLNKPPLFNWVLLGFMRLFGSDANWLFRLPTVASMLLSALLLWTVARRHLARRTALTAAAFLLTFPTLLFYGSLYGEIDVFYALLVMLQALAVFELEQRGRPAGMFVLSYLATAAGFLTKGMPTLAVQVLTVGVWLVHVRRWRWLFSWAHLAGLATFALCVGGYLAAYSRFADPAAYLAKLFFDATERTASGGVLHLGRTAVQLAGFPLQLASLAVPWVVFAPGLFTAAARERIRSTPFLRFCVAFVAANVAPYWLSPGNRPRYMFLFLPFLATLLAVGLEHLDEQGWYLRALRRLMAVALTAAALLLAALPFTRWGVHVAPLWAWLPVTALLAALAVGCWRARALRPALAALLLALPAVRVAYDLVIPALRRAESPDTFFENVAAVLNRDFRGERIQLLGRTREHRRSIPLTGVQLTVREQEWFPMVLCFRFSAGRNELLRYTEVPEPGGLYLVHPGLRLSRRHEVVRAFGAPRPDYETVSLIRVLE